MKERPILFSGPMVRAILEGRKTQTRRAVNFGKNALSPNGPYVESDGVDGSLKDGIHRLQKLSTEFNCKYGKPGDRLWVRETWTGTWHATDGLENMQIAYASDGGERFVIAPDDYVLPKAAAKAGGWVTPLFIKRFASRILLEITEVRVQRLQEISEEDAKAEGLATVTKDGSLWKWGIPDSDGLPGTDDTGWPWSKWDADPCMACFKLWDKINGVGSATGNPWVWAITFKVVQP